jgi:hypothetical protein
LLSVDAAVASSETTTASAVQRASLFNRVGNHRDEEKLTLLSVDAAVASSETTTASAVQRASLFNRVGNHRDDPAATKVSTTPLTSLRIRPTAFSFSSEEELAVILSEPRTSLFFLGVLRLRVYFCVNM